MAIRFFANRNDAISDLDSNLKIKCAEPVDKMISMQNAIGKNSEQLINVRNSISNLRAEISKTLQSKVESSVDNQENISPQRP